MDVLSLPPQLSIFPGVTLINGAHPEDCELIFLPSDRFGTPGQLNVQVMTQLGIKPDLPGEDELEQGYHVQALSAYALCFVVTVDGSGSVSANLKNNFAAALRDSKVSGARSLWIPLMGTGAGGLSFGESFWIIAEVLKQSQQIQGRSATATICVPPGLSNSESESLRRALDALKLDNTDASGAHTSYARLSMAAPVAALLEWAMQLRSPAETVESRVTPELIFQALAHSQSEFAPSALREDPAAEALCGAVELMVSSLAVSALATKASNRDSPPLLDEDAKALLTKAHLLAGGKDESVVSVDCMVKALLDCRSPSLVRLWTALNIDSAKLLRDYQDARVGRVATWFNGDVAAWKDQLGYDRYAEAICEFLRHSQTPPPVSISIQAPWGAGKSSLMQLIRHKLDPESEKYSPHREDAANDSHLQLGSVLRFLDRKETFDAKATSGEDQRKHVWTVWFNVWQYNSSEQIWAGLVDAIVSQISGRLPLIEREKFLLRLHLSRIDDGIVRRKIYDRIGSIWWAKVRGWALAVCGVTAAAVATTATAYIPGLFPKDAHAVGTYGLGVAAASQLVLWISLIAGYARTVMKTKTEPASFSLSEYMQVPDYNKSMGELHQIHADLRRVLSVVPSTVESEGENAANAADPIVVFIDDLDRCSPGKIAGLVEGVSMLLGSHNYRCMFVIGMDPQMIAAALERAHEEVRARLPRYERSVPLGWRFMDKFIQLPFTIPPSRKNKLQSYVGWLVDPLALSAPPQSAVTSNAPADSPDAALPISSLAPSPLAQPLAQVTAQVAPVMPMIPSGPSRFAGDRDLGAIIRMAAGYSGNPREMKRMVNLARFYLTLRGSRRRQEPDWVAPHRDQYARWIALTLCWPDMLRWLQWGADEAVWTADSQAPETDLVVRRLRLMEGEASAGATAKTWRESLNLKLNIPIECDTDWACDSKLFEFFHAEFQLPQAKRISTAAAQGFW